MDTVDFIICRFSAEHPYNLAVIRIHQINELYSRLDFWGSTYLTTLEKGLTLLFVFWQIILTCSLNLSLESIVTPKS